MRPGGEEDLRRRRRFSRRAAIVLGAHAAAGAVLLGRFHQLQVREGEQFATAAEQNRVDLELIAPRRGRVLDHRGAVLASDREVYALYLTLGREVDAEAALARLDRLLTLTPAERESMLERAYRRAARPGSSAEAQIASDVSWERFAQVQANAPALGPISARAARVRDYPVGPAAAHALGYVAAVSRADLQSDRDPSLRLPGARIGRAGLERAEEAALRGAPGARRVEKDARRREVRELAREPSRRGAEVRLTLDRRLQEAAYARLAGQNGAAVVLELPGGDIRAMVSTPSFDPNMLATGMSARDWAALNGDPNTPMLDRATAGLYPPGSTFKMITALAALEKGEPHPDESFDCRGGIDFGDRRFHCWKRSGHGPVDMRDAIVNSCDVYFYEVAKRVGMDKIADVAQRFGFGERFDLGLPQLRRGQVPTPDAVRADGGAWSGGDTLNAAIGQGAVLASPLELAVMAARIADGRRRVTPRLVASIDGAPPAPAPARALGVANAHLRMIHDGMVAVVNERSGTAYGARLSDPDLAIAGKTGTSQVRTISAAERAAGVRDNADLPWALRDHALFVAYAPAAAPRFAISVVVEHGGSGSQTAAPIARDILAHALYGGPPPADATPPEGRGA